MQQSYSSVPADSISHIGKKVVAPQTFRRAGPWPLQAARKPDSVLDDHSSRRRVAAPLQQPTRKFRLIRSSHPALAELGRGTRTPLNSPPGRIGPIRRCPLESAGAVPAYLVLLRVGFTVRRSLLAVRCALTAPFHPYPRRFARPGLRQTVRSWAVYFLLHWPYLHLEAQIPDVIRHTALRSPDFPPPPDERPGERPGRGRQRSSSRLPLECIAAAARARDFPMRWCGQMREAAEAAGDATARRRWRGSPSRIIFAA